MYANVLCRIVSPDPAVENEFHYAWKVEHHGSLVVLHLDKNDGQSNYAQPNGVLQIDTLDRAVEVMANW